MAMNRSERFKPYCSRRRVAHPPALESFAFVAHSPLLSSPRECTATQRHSNDGQGRCPASILAVVVGFDSPLCLPSTLPSLARLQGAASLLETDTSDSGSTRYLSGLSATTVGTVAELAISLRSDRLQPPLCRLRGPSLRLCCGPMQAIGEVFTVGAGQRQRWQTRQPWGRLTHAL